MSIDIDTFAAWVSRPDATPAPTAGPQDPPVITGPWCPRDVGLDADPVAHALHHLAPYGDLTLAAAVKVLGAWPDSGKLTAPQVAQVLAYYRPARLRRAAA
ncbi:hypothetical protein M2302_000306 [Micromonospora sp. A200]|uniref:hypothetical protein n=1 Tax=Micromonospora sp. A200 TaxID=2940568 RepID=UPI002477058C|nr:hypothetical protein [Micromonospora sp. A200]MDH6460155.1 hypothetical protein [Micromonospora sp. A200]